MNLPILASIVQESDELEDSGCNQPDQVHIVGGGPFAPHQPRLLVGYVKTVQETRSLRAAPTETTNRAALLVLGIASDIRNVHRRNSESIAHYPTLIAGRSG